MFDVCLDYVWLEFASCFGLCLVSMWFMFGLCLDYVWFRSGIMLVNVGCIFGLCMVQCCFSFGVYRVLLFFSINALVFCWFMFWFILGLVRIVRDWVQCMVYRLA